jgi:hypothetical protein
VLLLAIGAALLQIEPTYDPVRAAAEQRQLLIADALTPLDLLLAAAWRVLPLAVVVGLLVITGAWAVAALARFRQFARPDARGQLPVLLDRQDAAVAALGAYHQAAITRASIAPVPHSVSSSTSTHYAPHVVEHYAPRLDYRAEQHGAVALPGAEPASTLPGVSVPTFAQLLDAGRVGRGQPLVLGFDRDTGAELAGSWLDLYSCAVGGLSGSGKSWTAVFLASQAALYGARLLILDPHAQHPESLSMRLAPLRRSFVCAVADTPRAMQAAVELAAHELQRRIASGQRATPWIVLADEFSSLQRGELAEPLAALVEGIGQEGRKLGLYALVCGQVWNGSRAGGSELRDSLASAYVHRLRPAQARMLTGLTADDLPGDLLDLPAGTCYLLSTAGDLRPVVIPAMTPADVARVAGLLDAAPNREEHTPPSAPSSPPSATSPIGFRTPSPATSGEGAPEGAPEGATAAPLRGRSNAAQLTAEEAQIVAAFVAGKSVKALAEQLNGGSSGGDGYAKAARRVADILRRALGGALGEVQP